MTDDTIATRHHARQHRGAVFVRADFIYGYNETGGRESRDLPGWFGLAYTLAFTHADGRALNILTITFVPISSDWRLFTACTDQRYEEELSPRKNRGGGADRRWCSPDRAFFTGALTTAGAFLAMAFTNFKGIQEMGIICGGGLLLCFIPMMTMLPVICCGDGKSH